VNEYVTELGQWYWPEKIRAIDPQAPDASARYRALLQAATDDLKSRFLAEESIEALVRARAGLIDELLVYVWPRLAGAHQGDWALIAVGGYGRGELHPCSDVDVLLLVPSPPNDAEKHDVETLVAFLWDTGLELGHSVRTIEECCSESRADVSVMTTLVEARLVAGAAKLFERARAALAAPQLWPAQEFFAAKVREQQERHLKANDTAYNLEPNVKTGPGGLRDIQTIAWVAKRHFNCATLEELAAHGFLAPAELRRLRTAQAFLWRVRFALHVETGRREDRLLFDHQVKIAKVFGYEDASFTLAVEQLMQRYYRTVMDVSFLNELLLQLFREAIVDRNSDAPQPLNPRFQIRDESIEAVNDDVFARTPSALLEIFVLLQQHPRIKGVRAATMRAINRNLWLIDEEFRQNPRHHRLFIDLLRAPAGVTHEFRRMNTYGVLGRYIPAFGRIVGRMQYDLFHAYTVDAHTLFVLSNLRRLAIPRYDRELPALSAIMQQLPRPELAYLAALFHDIAKGRGGDHSELGSVDAEAFCLEQGLSRYDARLVAWLVRAHLKLSVTAQKQDITDPDVINEFARFVGDEAHLDYLYVLTVSDVRGTNPKLWNSWKASLFQDFYERVKRALRRGLETPIDAQELREETQTSARQILLAGGLAAREIDSSWQNLGDAYFLRHTPEEVAWHTQLIAASVPGEADTLVALHAESAHGTTAVTTFSADRLRGFARVTAVLDQLGLTIVDARITPTNDGGSLDLYHILEGDGSTIVDRDRLAEIELALRRALQSNTQQPLAVTRRASRQMRMFHTPTQITLSADERNRRTVLELTAGDRPGLLCDIGQALLAEQVALQGAKIVTVGERAEDVFYVTDAANKPLSDTAARALQSRLQETLDRRRAA
jgi:[protein-PII] uridylyltransferase